MEQFCMFPSVHICLLAVTKRNNWLFLHVSVCVYVYMCQGVVFSQEHLSTTIRGRMRWKKAKLERHSVFIQEKLKWWVAVVSGCNSSFLCGCTLSVMLHSEMQEVCRLCYPIVTPQILTSNQINSVPGSGVPLKQKHCRFRVRGHFRRNTLEHERNLQHKYFKKRKKSLLIKSVHRDDMT